MAEQPSPAQRPETVGGAAADAQGFGSILVRQAGEVAQLHQPGRIGVVAFQPVERLVQGDEVVTAGWRASGLSSLYPKGIPIGKVTSVGQTDTDLFQQVQVDPFVDFGALDAVLVLVPRERRR